MYDAFCSSQGAISGRPCLPGALEGGSAASDAVIDDLAYECKSIPPVPPLAALASGQAAVIGMTKRVTIVRAVHDELDEYPSIAAFAVLCLGVHLR